jgi:hypothetical protein
MKEPDACQKCIALFAVVTPHRTASKVEYVRVKPIYCPHCGQKLVKERAIKWPTQKPNMRKR